MPYEKGFRNGPKCQALLRFPRSITLSPDGTFVLFSDSQNHCIRKICLKSEQVSTFAGIPGKKGDRTGPKEQALFNQPDHLTFSPDGKIIFVCDNNNIKCIKIKN
jgi:sugar lactone lactonase YvrE